MVYLLNNNLKLETDIPILKVGAFCLKWELDEHAQLSMEGYLNRNSSWRYEQVYDKQIHLSIGECSFRGYLGFFKTTEIGQTTYFNLRAYSGSYLMMRRITSRSFQDMSKTYGEIVRSAVGAENGKVIRNRESDKILNYPIIQDEESAWEFAKRMAAQIGTCVIPDIVTGNPDIWFGMRKGKELSLRPDTSYEMSLVPIGRKPQITLHIIDREFYKIGDNIIFMGRKMTITEVTGDYIQGDLNFHYVLKDMALQSINPEYNKSFSGVGFWGTIKEVREEKVTIALDIDGGNDSGSYFFSWYPETGNALYVMPEVGAKALLQFFSDDGQDGAVIHCLNKKNENMQDYKQRWVNFKDGNSIQMGVGKVKLIRGVGHELSLTNSSVRAETEMKMSITAKGKVRVTADKLQMNSPDEFNIYSG